MAELTQQQQNQICADLRCAMRETEMAFWAIIIVLASIYVISIIAGWVAEYKERKRITKIIKQK